MKSLTGLLADINIIKIFGEKNKQISEVVVDSRKVKKDCLFVATRGQNIDAHALIPDALKNGATVIVGEKEPQKSWLENVTYIQVKNAREALGYLAAAWFDNPSHKMRVIGVTGTDGKTTTSNLIWWILTQSGKKAGLISTINARIGEKVFDTGFHVTNPEALELQKYLSLMVDEGCEYAVVEVTSHGIDQERVTGVRFDTAVLTNITHEHIDYHRTYQKYLETKAKLFKNVNLAILNRDDSSFDQIKKYVNTSAKVIAYGKDTLTKDLKSAVNKRFPESYNRLNATAAICVAKKLNVDEKKIISAIENFEGLEGRMEEIKNDKSIKIFVDFAHTPNSLENVLGALSEIKGDGRLIVVFGCAGLRDIQKRKLMPKVAVRLADISVFTAEDPRSENIEDILAVMTAAAKDSGAIEGKDFINIPERGQAIFTSINEIAKKGDIVVICGKGHEKSMAYDNVEYPWSDQEAVRKSLNGELVEIPWKK